MVRAESDLVKPRNEALYRAYKKALRENPSLSSDGAVEVALKSEQPRMWVAFYGVYRMLLRIVHNSRNSPKTKSREYLEREVSIKYSRLIKQRAFSNMSLFFMASFIIAEPSRGFYMSNKTAKKIIGKMRKKYQSAWKKDHSKDTSPRHSC